MDCLTAPEAPNLLPRCLCGEGRAHDREVNGLPVLECATCGLQRQRVALTPEQYRAWYEQDYHESVYSHSLAHDRMVAEKRVTAYGNALQGRILDVGAGNGAFVDACRAHGLEAWGQDVANPSGHGFIYNAPLREVHFPTDWADVVTLHDVLEHLIDPKAELAEIARILKSGGRLIVDFPEFHVPEGRHHWKATEHLWFLTEHQLFDLIESQGFRVTGLERPIPGKLVAHAERLAEKRPTILVPAGIGDIYWVMVKLRAFLEANGLGLPDIWIDCPDDRKRSLEFVRRIPFVNAAGYFDRKSYRHPAEKPFAGLRARRARQEAYRGGGRCIFADVDGHDWFFSVNGRIDQGESLDEIEPQYAADWDLPLFVSIPERRYGNSALEALGPYVVASFFSERMYGKWLEELPAPEIYQALHLIHRATGAKVILTGAAWDKESDINRELLALRNWDSDPDWLHSVIGETSLEEYFGLLRHARGCIGFPAGNTMMGPAFDVPTTIIWNDHFDRRFHVNACRPGAPYRALNTALHDAEDVAAEFLSLINLS